MNRQWLLCSFFLVGTVGVLFTDACTIWNGVTLDAADASPGAQPDAETPTSGYSETVLSAKPIAYWRFDAIENGHVVRDVSGHNHDCTASVGVSTEDGPIAGIRAARLGENGGIDCSGSTDFGFPELSPFTFETFALLDDEGARGEEQFRFVFDRMAGGMPSNRLGYYAFFYRKANSDDWALALERWTGDSRQVGVNVTSSAELAPGKWAHFAVTQEASGKLSLYLNGSLRNDATTIPTPPSSHVNLFLGRNQGGSCCGLVGKIAEMAIFDRALDAATIKAHYGAAFPAAP